VSDEKQEAGKHAKPAEEDPKWPEDTGQALDEWLDRSNREAEGK
jgi:hypothetical protein